MKSLDRVIDHMNKILDCKDDNKKVLMMKEIYFMGYDDSKTDFQEAMKQAINEKETK